MDEKNLTAKYHANIPFDIARRSAFIPDEILNQADDRVAYVRAVIDKLVAVLLASDASPRIKVVEIIAQKVQDGNTIIPGRYIEVRLPIGDLPDIVDSELKPHGNVVAGGMIINPGKN